MLILVELIVLIVDKVVDKKGICVMVEVYFEYFYFFVGQEIVVKNFYRFWDKNIVIKYFKQFLELNLFIIDKFFGWDEVYKKYFL